MLGCYGARSAGASPAQIGAAHPPPFLTLTTAIRTTPYEERPVVGTFLQGAPDLDEELHQLRAIVTCRLSERRMRGGKEGLRAEWTQDDVQDGRRTLRAININKREVHAGEAKGHRTG